MPNVAAASTETRDRLVGQVEILSQEAVTALAQFDRSTTALYKVLVEVLLLWKQCANEPGLLEHLYLSIRYKKPPDDLPTLVPFLRVIFKKSKIVAKEHARFTKWNIALLCLLYELHANPKRYRANPVPKLVAFISKSGGLDGLLTGEDKARIEREENVSLLKDETEFNPFREAPVEQMLATAIENIKHGVAVGSVVPNEAVRIGEDDLSALLIRRTNAGSFEILGSTNRRDAIGLVAHHMVRSSTSRLEAELKAIVDTIHTQAYPPLAMPASLLAREKWLTDVYRDQTRFLAKNVPGRIEKKKNERLLSAKKLHIDGSSATLTLSSSRVRASVVTKCSGMKSSVAADHQCCLPGRDLLLLERMLETGEINAIDVIDHRALRPISMGSKHLYSLQLKRPTPQKVKIITLYDPSRDSGLDSAFQSDFDFSVWSPKWSFSVPQKWFVELRERFLDRWFATLGANKQVKRLNNQVFELATEATALRIGFNLSEAGSPKPFEMPISRPQTTALSPAFYLSKDLGPVLYNLADMDIESPVMLSGNSDALVASFTSTIGNVQIAVPTAKLVKEQYERIDRAFHERRYA